MAEATTQKVIIDDLDALLSILPPHVRLPLSQQSDIKELLEVVLDVGRVPEARFIAREIMVCRDEVTPQDIEYVVARVGAFGDDNRAGIQRTLHRISAIRNRKGSIVGLTLRVGRAVFGTIRTIEDLVQSGRSVLLLGRPGVGKTTMLREVARVLADDLKKRVIIVDTSNEIAGDGDIPHPAIGHARRMQVTTPVRQHAVMIEAVENHMPEVIVIDEIGTDLEAQAARTIAERGVQLVGTAHGNTLENLMLNPTLADLIGGIQTVTLSDEEAKRRGTQKSILERMAPPTFDIVVEIQDWKKVTIHPDVAGAVDAILRGQPAPTETRWLDAAGRVKISRNVRAASAKEGKVKPQPQTQPGNGETPRLFLFGINRGRLEEAARDMDLDVRIVDRVEDATLFVTSKAFYRRKPQLVRDAEAANLPIYAVKSNTQNQMRHLLGSLYRVQEPDAMGAALQEAEDAVTEIKAGHEPIELSPQSAYIRRLQHLVAERYSLSSQSCGQEPYRRVRISRG